MNETQGTSPPLPPPSGAPQPPMPAAPAPPYSPPPAVPSDASASAALIASLAATAGWARFVAILGFIQMGLLGLVGLGLLAFGFPGIESPFGRLIGLLYAAMAAVYLFPLLPLYGFASEASRLKSNPSLAIAAEALRLNRSFWKVVGIFCIIALAMIPLGIIAAIISGAMLAAMQS